MTTASVPITLLLYNNGSLLCGFNVGIKGFIHRQTDRQTDTLKTIPALTITVYN